MSIWGHLRSQSQIKRSNFKKCQHVCHGETCTIVHVTAWLDLRLKGQRSKKVQFQTLERFNFWICTWHHVMFEIRFYFCVPFIKYWFLESRYPSVLVPTYHLLFPFILYSWCIVFIDNLRARNDKLLRELGSLRKSTKKTEPVFPFKISISIVVYKDFEG